MPNFSSDPTIPLPVSPKKNRVNGSSPLPLILMAVVTVAALSYAWFATHRVQAMSTPYQAVLLSNGSAYFGHLEGLGNPFPILTEVYYVQSSKNPQTNQVSNILVKRGKEWHSPDRMLLNASLIVLVEPVSPGSRVAQLIAEARGK